MSIDTAKLPRGLATQSAGLVLPTLVVASLLVVVAPVSPICLDLLLAANITGAIVLLLATMFVSRPLDFSAFPTLLLLTTLARLVLNIASTRLVLTRAATHGTSAAGEVIQTFARFVAQDQLAVGLILFSILVVIQFVVVTKGATRLSEVAARFALDGMPGRQMAVDADLNAGAITADEARHRRTEITALADFYAAMDGAGKFVRGDAMAGLLITLVNLFGGIAIGMFQYGMAPARAVEVFALLTIGDGLATQIPSFLIGLSAALLATRSSAQTNLSRDVVGQTFHDPSALFLAAATTLGLAFTGLPMVPLLILGTGCTAVGEMLRRKRNQAELQHERDRIASAKPLAPVAARPEDQLNVEPIELDLGYRLISLESPETGSGLMDQIGQLRQRVAQEIGILLPKVKIRDSLRLKDRSYQIKLRGAVVARGDVQPDRLLAVDTGLVSGTLGDAKDGDFVDPASNQPGKWISAAQVEQARELGYKIVEPVQVLMAHLAEVVRSHADELLTRQQVHQLLDNLRQTSPRVVDELIPALLKPSQVHQVLANLLRERTPIRDLESILSALGDHAEQTKNTSLLTEHARQALGRVICQPLRDPRGTIHAITLDPSLEDLLVREFDLSNGEIINRLTPQMSDAICHELSRQAKKLASESLPPVVVCSPKTRRIVRAVIAGSLPRIAVLGLNEIPRGITIQPRGQIPLAVVKLPVSAVSPRRSGMTESRATELVPASIS